MLAGFAKDSFESVKSGVKEYGVPAAALAATLYAAKEASERLTMLGRDAKDPTKKATLPAWAPPALVIISGILLASYLGKSKNKWAQKSASAVGLGAFLMGGLQLGRFAVAKSAPDSFARRAIDKVPLAGIGETTGYAIGFLRGGPVSVEEVRRLAGLDGGPVSIQEVRRLAGLGLGPVIVNPATALRVGPPMSRAAASTL